MEPEVWYNNLKEGETFYDTVRDTTFTVVRKGRGNRYWKVKMPNLKMLTGIYFEDGALYIRWKPSQLKSHLNLNTVWSVPTVVSPVTHEPLVSLEGKMTQCGKSKSSC